HISTVHRAIDPRIRLKQLRTITNYGFEAYLVTADPAASYDDGVRVLSIADREHGRWRRVCITAPLAIWKALRIPAEIYHFHDPELLPWAWLLLLRRVPVIYDVHEDYSLALNQKFYLPMRLRRLGSAGIGKLEKALAAPFSIIIAEHCYKKRFPKSWEILNYPSRELVERGDALDPSSTHLLYTGNITIERGVLNLVRLVRELPEIELTLAGECKAPVLEKIRELIGSAADRLHIVGEGRFVPFEEIQALYTEKRWLAGIVLISESEHYREKQLTKFFEYMAAGLPIIASDFPAWRKLIEDQGVGFCVDPEDMGEVKKTIRYLNEHQDETREMGRKGRNLVKNKYSWELEGEHLISLYRGSRIK
ncbi:MAG: glycosyltransferase, partial [Spirochaetales bacterium]|nr:glycosyltransferase [Spirochaetales bacterium]